MLNRIYIIIGTLAIIVLAAAFIAPQFIRWSDYRGRMEELATAMLGTPVTVRGDIDFTLLPQPRLHFDDVLVGSTEAPAATVDSIEAEFALIDFLRDNYTITRLVLRQPVIDFTVDESGFFGSGVSIETGNGGVGLGQTSIVGATVRLIDARSGENFVASDVSGDLRLSNFTGPFGFTGSGVYGGTPYSVRLNSSAADDTGRTRLSAFLQPQSGAFTVSAEGLLAPGMAPKFEGDLIYRQRPEATTVAEDIRGDLVLESKVAASTDRIVLSGYTLRPDENRGGTRLTGAASIQLGDMRSFDAVISGGVFSLPPRDAKEDASAQPYEAVRLLSELPAPLVPPMAGRIGIDLAEVGLRGFALREVRVDARTDGERWTVEQFTAQLPGDTQLRLSGTLTRDNERPAFRGEAVLASNRLDGLVALWRKPEESNPLFNVPATLAGKVMLGADAFGVSDGVFTLAQQQHRLEVRLGFGAEKRLDVVGSFDGLDSAGSAVVAAMLPDFAGEAAFGNSFPLGSFSITAKAARVWGLDGTRLLAEGQWGGGQLSFAQLSAETWGGVGFDARLVAGGTLAELSIWGSGVVRTDSGTAPALLRLYDLAAMPENWRDYLALSAPASLLVDIAEPVDDLQTVTLGGTLGAGELNLRAELSGGLAGLATAPMRVTGGLESSDVDALTAQIGLGDAALFAAEGSMLVSLSLEGAPSNSLVGNLTASLGDETVSFAGSLVAVGGEIQGTGTLDARLADVGALARIAGARGLTLPPGEGSAQLHFEGDRLARLTDIAGVSGKTGFAGALSLSRTGVATAVSGDIRVDLLSVEGLAATLFGPAALLEGDAAWPEGPLGTTTQARQTRGTVRVSAPELAAGDVGRLGETRFELNWDETRTRLARFEAVADLGQVGLDIAVCCAGPLAERTVSGRLTLSAVPLDMVVPPRLADMLDGTLDGGLRFEGTGASLAEVMATASGEGNFTMADFAASQLSPGVFGTVAGLEDVLDTEPEVLRSLMSVALGQGNFAAPTAAGAFALAGGVARLANLIIESEDATIAGGLNLTLSSLGLNGSFVMTPSDLGDPDGLVRADTARIITRIGGTLPEPEVTLDLDEIIAAVLVRANEMEVDRLEALQAEDAARQRAAAEERNRLIEEQRRRAAEEAARLAAEEAARAAEEQQRLLDQQQAEPPADPTPGQTFEGPLDLGLPQFNQPIGSGVNQPL